MFGLCQEVSPLPHCILLTLLVMEDFFESWSQSKSPDQKRNFFCESNSEIFICLLMTWTVNLVIYASYWQNNEIKELLAGFICNIELGDRLIWSGSLSPDRTAGARLFNSQRSDELLNYGMGTNIRGALRENSSERLWENSVQEVTLRMLILNIITFAFQDDVNFSRERQKTSN